MPQWAAWLIAGLVIWLIGSVSADRGILELLGLIIAAVGVVLMLVDLVGSRRP